MNTIDNDIVDLLIVPIYKIFVSTFYFNNDNTDTEYLFNVVHVKHGTNISSVEL